MTWRRKISRGDRTEDMVRIYRGTASQQAMYQKIHTAAIITYNVLGEILNETQWESTQAEINVLVVMR